MIKVAKSTEVPKPLREKGAAATNILKQLFDENLNRYQSATTLDPASFTFDDSIYGAAEVREQIYSDQHSKCCYCERPLVKPIQVEHWFPKSAIQAQKGGSIRYPGFYWLAYEWTNLFAACFTCNNSKGVCFPLLEGVDYPDRHHSPPVEISEVLLVHPAVDEPENHITFEEEIIKPVNGSEKGKNTILICGLNSDETELLRQKHLRAYRHAAAVVSLADTHKQEPQAHLLHPLNLYDIQEVKDFIEEARMILIDAPVSGPFAGMIRANFPNRA